MRRHYRRLSIGKNDANLAGANGLVYIRKNNDRDWFLANKAKYEESVRAPLIELVHEVGTELDEYSPGYVTDPKRAVYRIYRDVRFSKDKSPYKTHLDLWFWEGSAHNFGGAACD